VYVDLRISDVTRAPLPEFPYVVPSRTTKGTAFTSTWKIADDSVPHASDPGTIRMNIAAWCLGCAIRIIREPKARSNRKITK